MAHAFEPPSMPKPPAIPPPPPLSEVRTTASKAGAGELAAAKKRKGRSSTILTGPLGLTAEPELGRKTLLGA